MVTKDEAEELIVKLHKEDKGTREISKVVRKNFNFIGAVLRKRFPEEYADNPVLSKETQALKLFSMKKTPTQVAIELDLAPDECEKFYTDFWRLERQNYLYRIYKDYKPFLREFVWFLKELKKRGITTPKKFNDILEVADNNNEIYAEVETMKKRMPLLNKINSNDDIYIMNQQEMENAFQS